MNKEELLKWLSEMSETELDNPITYRKFVDILEALLEE